MPVVFDEVQGEVEADRAVVEAAVDVRRGDRDQAIGSQYAPHLGDDAHGERHGGTAGAVCEAAFFIGQFHDAIMRRAARRSTPAGALRGAK